LARLVVKMKKGDRRTVRRNLLTFRERECDMKGYDNRNFIRARVGLNDVRPAELFIRNTGNKTQKVKLHDLSERGVHFEHTADLIVDNVCNATIMIPDQDAVIICTGTIRHKKPLAEGFAYGMELYLNAEDERSLDLYVMRTIN
jgi:hypothetical protein